MDAFLGYAESKIVTFSFGEKQCCGSVNGRTNFKLVLPYSFRKVKSENLKGEFTRSQRPQEVVSLINLAS